MSKHTQIGDIAAPVGYYTDGEKQKKRYRNVGVLMRTEDQDGIRFWIKLNAEVIQPSLLIQMKPNMEKGADAAILTVFEPREKTSSQKPAATEGDQADDIPF